MSIARQTVKKDKFNCGRTFPFNLRTGDFELAMQDVYDFLFDVNSQLADKKLRRLDDMLRPAACSGILSDMLTASLANHSRVLTENLHHNGHPDLIVDGRYKDNAIKAAPVDGGVEVKCTRKAGGAVDTHGAREQWMCVFVYRIDNETQPAINRAALKFTEVYLGRVEKADFRKNSRGELGTRTATLHKHGIAKLRREWVYLDK